MPACPACQHVSPDTAKFCAECGASLRPPGTTAAPGDDTGERRFLTVMFCDLVGSSALAEELGAEDFREVLRAVHASSAGIVERYGGQVSQYLGDGILVLFGHPQAHEDDAARAVQAAAEIQAAIAAAGASMRTRVDRFSGELHSRAAIHSGLVVIGEVGAGERRPIVALGETVNVAAHLQKLAPVDGILVTAATRRLIGAQFELEPHGTPRLPKPRAPLDVFRVVAVPAETARHDAARRGELTPFVGRSDELTHLSDRWERVLAGRGQVVFIGGEPGIGKSRLLAALRRTLPPPRRWLELRGSAYHQASQLRPILDLVERRVLEGRTGAEGRARLERQLADVTIGGAESVQLLASLLSLPPSQQSPAAPMPPDQQRRRVLDALIRWVRRLAVEAPTVIAFEDLQWFDPTTLELLRSLVASVHDRRICLLLTARTPFEPPWDRQPNELRLVLNPLTRAEAQALVTSIAAEHPVPEPILRDVLARSDGVPLFLEEVTRMLIDAPQGIASVPETLQDLLAARLDRLPPSVVDTIQIAAVVGRQFTRELLAAASTKDSTTVAADVSALLASGIVQDERGGLSFKHVLLRDSVYQRMLRARRREVHARIASTLLDGFPHVAATQPELVAHHLTEAGAADAAFREWSRAGRRSLGNGAYREAAHHFEQALAVRYQGDRGGDDRQIAELQEELGVRKDFGVSLIATQGYTSPAVADNYARALRLSATAHQRDADIPIPVLYGLWGTCLVRGDREATGELARHFDRARQSDDSLTRHVACSALGALAFYEGRFAEARRHCEEAMRLYRPADHFVLLRDYGFEGGIYSQLYVACILCFTGHPDRGLDVVRQALTVADSLGDPHARAMSLALAACIARERREPAEAARLSDDLVALATEQHFIMWLGIAHCLRGWSRLIDGDVAGGSREIREGLAAWEATGAKVPGTYLRLTLVEAALASGDLDGALAVVEQGLTQCRETLESYQAPEYHRLKGEILARKQDVRAAEGEFRRALAAARAQGATWLELRAALSLGRLAAHTPVADAPARLADVVSRIGDGALTPDMREARAMLSPSP